MKTKLFCFMKNAIFVLTQFALCITLLLSYSAFTKAQTNNQNEEQLKLDLLLTDTITYRAEAIESQQQINNKSKIKYLANDRITLDTDFSIEENVEFKAAIIEECGTLEEKVDRPRMNILKVNKTQKARFKVLEVLLPKTEENSTTDNLPRYNYLINYGDGNYDIFKSQDNFDRVINYTYKDTGTYNVKALRIKLPPKELEDDERVGNQDFDLVHLAEKTLSIKERNESLQIDNRNFIKNNVEITFFPEKPISGELVTVIASIKNDIDIYASEAYLSFSPDCLREGNMDIYYNDIEGTENCEDELIVNLFNLKANEQRNFFSYFRIDTLLGNGDSVKVCLQHQLDSICKFAKIGNPHDPSFKILANIDKCIEQDSLNFIGTDQCVIGDELDFFMNIENDGTGETPWVKVIDYFEPALPCLKVKDVIWDDLTFCEMRETGMHEISENGDSVTFDFPNLVLKGQRQKDVDYEETREQFAFTFLLEEPILDPTYWCNKADILFLDADPYTIETCFYCFGKNYEILNGPPPPTKEYFFINNDTIKERPTFFKENLFTTRDNQTITITPNLSELPNEIDEDDLEYIWWPNQETTKTITVSPTQNTNYRLRVSWMQNDTLCYATDYVFVETQCFYGCTNPEALNYDSLAVCDNGSCRYCEEESNENLFTMFDWLNEKVDQENCNAENIKITHYKRQGNYDFIGIEIEGVVNYYRDNGNYLNYTKEQIRTNFLNGAYSICTWECEGEKRNLCETYPWLSNFYNGNVIGGGTITTAGGAPITITSNMGSIIESYKYYNNDILYIVDSLDNGIVYIDFDHDDSEPDPVSGIPYYPDDGKRDIITSLINDGYDIQFQKSWQCQIIDCH